MHIFSINTKVQHNPHLSAYIFYYCLIHHCLSFQDEDLKWIDENIPASVADTYVEIC